MLGKMRIGEEVLVGGLVAAIIPANAIHDVERLKAQHRFVKGFAVDVQVGADRGDGGDAEVIGTAVGLKAQPKGFLDGRQPWVANDARVSLHEPDAAALHAFTKRGQSMNS